MTYPREFVGNEHPEFTPHSRSPLQEREIQGLCLREGGEEKEKDRETESESQRDYQETETVYNVRDILKVKCVPSGSG